jgi:hypothetical protein
MKRLMYVALPSCINPSGIEDGFRFCLVRLQIIEDHLLLLW